MKDKCFEIGAIQAFLDGETTPDVSLRLADHIAACDRCSQLMAVAEDENSYVFSALERELDTLVPTQRLWVRINDSITEEKNRAPYWHKIYSYVRISFANPSLTAAAGVVLVLGIFAVVSVREGEREIAKAPEVAPRQSTPPVFVPGPGPSDPTQVASTDTKADVPSENVAKPSVQYTRYSPKEMRNIAETARPTQRFTPQNTIYTDEVPGEESYIKTIADLKQNVEDQKDAVMTPSTRVSYERDMAVVNDSIKRMREVVKKNPRNQAARQVLYSSYQDKIDLLNSVAQREELMAAMR